MKKKTRTILMILLALVFVISAGWSVFLLARNHREKAFYAEAQQTYVEIAAPAAPAPDEAREAPAPAEESAETPDEPPAEQAGPEVRVDFDALLAAGRDVKAWLYVPGTNISYPVVQGPDNKTYERRDYTGAYAWAGSIFLDYRSAADFSGRNPVLYGHNIKNDTMFSQLMRFRDGAFLAENPLFYVVTPEGQRTYEIFAVMIADALGPAYTFSFADDEAYARYLTDLIGDAVLTAGTQPTAEDQIVLLSTCTNRQRTERLLVAGRLLPEAA